MNTPARTLSLSGATNFRDLGGYRAADGRTVRWRRLFRSNHLGRLTAEDIAVLDALGLHAVCDLRGRTERERAACVLQGPAVHSLPIEPAIIGRLQAMVANNDVLETDVLIEMMRDTYRSYAREHVGPYRTLFAHILAAEGPVVFHCSAGKDRTGFGAALILSALGVPRETVVEDYLLTNRHWKMDAVSRHGLPETAHAVLGSVEESFLVAAFDAIESDHGGMDDFLRTAIGLGDAERRRLADLYLED